MRLNLGCGTTHVLQDWVNIDGSINARLAQYPRIRRGLYRLGVLPKDAYEVKWERYIDDILLHDIQNGLPFDDKTADYVFSSHLIEHLAKEDAIELLSECRRVLKPDGIVRISTPDLQILVQDYFENIEGNEYSTDCPPADRLVRRLHFPVEKSRKTLLTRLLDTTVYRMHQHKWLYDEQSLSDMFMTVGFTEENVSRCSYQQGDVPDLNRLDNRQDHSLYMEATKQ